MTDQTPMDAERLAEIRRKIDQWARGTYDATEEEFEEVIFTDIPDLLAEVGRLSAERDEYRRALRYLVGNEWEESVGDTLSEKAMSTVIDRQAAELSRLRAVIEEAREEARLIYESGALSQVGLLGLFLILDRGLKGDGE